MRFIKLESRGGNYLVVAENVAWLRSGENGQTNVGIVGGQPLLVAGSIEEVAAKLLAGAETVVEAPARIAPDETATETALTPAPEPPAPAPVAPPERPAAPVSAPPKPKSAPSPRQPAAAEPRRAAPEIPAAPANKGLKLKMSTQRMMGRFD